MLTEGTCDTGEVVLHYVRWADATARHTPLVLLHGITYSWQYWTPLFEKIGSGRLIYAVDARGHGKSGRVRDGYRLIDYPRDQQVFLRQVVKEPAVVIGHSLGAMNALTLAAENPKGVRALVLEDPPLYFGERGFGLFEPLFSRLKMLSESDLDVEGIAEEIANVMPGIPLTLARAHAQCLIQLDPQTLGQALDGAVFASWHTDPLLTSITCPVLLLVGDVALGGALTPAEANRAEKALAACRTILMRHVGHMIHTEQPRAFAENVRTFLHSLKES